MTPHNQVELLPGMNIRFGIKEIHCITQMEKNHMIISIDIVKAADKI